MDVHRAGFEELLNAAFSFFLKWRQEAVSWKNPAWVHTVGGTSSVQQRVRCQSLSKGRRDHFRRTPLFFFFFWFVFCARDSLCLAASIFGGFVARCLLSGLFQTNRTSQMGLCETRSTPSWENNMRIEWHMPSCRKFFFFFLNPWCRELLSEMSVMGVCVCVCVLQTNLNKAHRGWTEVTESWPKVGWRGKRWRGHRRAWAEERGCRGK